MGAYQVTLEGALDLKRFANGLPGRIEMNAVRAVNKTAEAARKKIADRMRQQIAFPQGYLEPAQKRLVLAHKATRRQQEAVIRAQMRPTSLARFVIGRPSRGQKISVRVKPGQVKRLPQSAFLMRLRSGTSLTETKYNLGLAMRLRPGETIQGAHSKVRMANGLYLLYGPSVGQAMLNRNGSGIAKDVSDVTLGMLEAEFERLMSVEF